MAKNTDIDAIIKSLTLEEKVWPNQATLAQVLKLMESISDIPARRPELFRDRWCARKGSPSYQGNI